MKKILLIVLFGVVCNYSYAQIAWGVRAGLCYSTITGGGESISGKPSLEIGPTAYYSLKENVYLNSGLMFSLKNFKAVEESLTGYYLDIPVFLGYAFNVGQLDLYAQAGPYIGLKLGESYKWEGESEDADFLSGFNFGLGTAVGVNLNKFKVELGYQHGLSNIVKGAETTVTMGSAFVGVSYVF
jgi:hypothetical protein